MKPAQLRAERIDLTGIRLKTSTLFCFEWKPSVFFFFLLHANNLIQSTPNTPTKYKMYKWCVPSRSRNYVWFCLFSFFTSLNCYFFLYPIVSYRNVYLQPVFCVYGTNLRLPYLMRLALTSFNVVNNSEFYLFWIKYKAKPFFIYLQTDIGVCVCVCAGKREAVIQVTPVVIQWVVSRLMVRSKPMCYLREKRKW